MLRLVSGILVLACLVALGAPLAGCGDDDPPPSTPTSPLPEVGPGDPGASSVPPSQDESWIRERDPEVTIVVVGNQRGKLKPCGCSEPQMGGLERLGAFLDGLRHIRKDASIGVLSMGWSMADRGEAQAETKAALYRRAIALLGFDAHLLGTTDLSTAAMAQPFESEHALDRPAPPANTKLSERGPLAQAAQTTPIVDLKVGALDVRALSLLDTAHFGRLGGVADGVFPPDGAMGRLPPREDALWVVSTDATGETIERVRAAMRRLGPSVIIDFERGAGLDVVEDMPLEREPLLVSLSTYGKDVGVLDLERDGEGQWRLSWHVVSLYPGIGSKKSEARLEIGKLFEFYKSEVRDREFLRSFPSYREEKHARYVGSGRCAECHEEIYDDWTNTAHAYALETLVKRRYHWDPECVRCHVVGFERLNDGRWTRASSAFVDPERTPYLAGVGCESCHGPGAAHLEDPTDEGVFGEGGTMRRNPSRRVCETCHDVENSHAFPEHYEDRYLPRVDHRRIGTGR